MFGREEPLTVFLHQRKHVQASRHRHQRSVQQHGLGDGTAGAEFTVDDEPAPTEQSRELEREPVPPDPDPSPDAACPDDCTAVILSASDPPLADHAQGTSSVEKSRPGEYTPDSFDELPQDEIYLGAAEPSDVYEADKNTEQVKASDPDDLATWDLTSLLRLATLCPTSARRNLVAANDLLHGNDVEFVEDKGWSRKINQAEPER